MADYPPYVGAPGSLPKLFSGIKAAAVPPKVTQDFLRLSSTSSLQVTGLISRFSRD